LTGFLIAFGSTSLINPPDKYQVIFTQVTDMLEVAHYSPRKIDDEFSKNIFKKYLDALDPDKNLFIANDIKELRKFETLIDNELHEFSHPVFLCCRSNLFEANQ